MSVAIITGSAGLVGSEAVAYFAAQGMDVVGIDNGMRAQFFGEEASTLWVRRRLTSEIARYRHYEVDIRDTDLQRRDAVIRKLEESCEATSAKRQVQIHTELLNADAPAESGPTAVTALSEACRKHGFDFLTMTSRAYHDSLFMSRISPVAMLFIPCRNGYSHRPDEYSSPEDIARGALVLAETLATLAA